jgi:hypothetical protein
VTLTALAPLAEDSEPRPLLPLSEVVGGLRGEVRTVFSGNRVETVPLEIIGVAPGFAGPGRDVIVARLDGERVRETGVVAGMSGSPVSVDGRLVGALAYRIGSFTREPIAGITPIEQMLAIPDSPLAGEASPAGTDPRYPVMALAGLAAWPERAEPMAEPLFSTPLAVSGLHPAVQSHYAPLLAQQGLGPMMGAVVGNAVSSTGEPLRPGDPVAAVLIGGDMTMAGTGTVTLVEGRRVLALGHPLARAGAVDFPMARAEIVVTVSSLAGSFKMSRVGETVGAFHQDRPQGLAGRLGDEARLVPVRLSFGQGETPRGTLSFEIVRAPALTPGLLEVVLANSLMSHDLGARTGTIHVAGSIQVAGYPPLTVSSSYAGGQGGLPLAFQAARHAAGLVAVLQTSPFGAEMDLAVDLAFRLEPEVRLLRLEEVRAQREEVRPGDVVQVSAFLRDAATGVMSEEIFEVPIPRLPRGTRLELQVGDRPSLAAADGAILMAGITRARSARGLLQALSRLRSSDGLYLRLARPARGVTVGADALPDLPPSVAAVIEGGASNLSMASLNHSVIAEQEKRLPGVVAGSGRLFLTLQ